MSSESVAQHKANAPDAIRCGVITVSDTRTVETDKGGALVYELLTSAGHCVLHRQIIKDEPDDMRQLIRQWMASSRMDAPPRMDAPSHVDAVGEVKESSDLQAILLTGGTGITSRDQTYETIEGMLTKPLPGYGELFRMLSYSDIGSAAMLSRATGGLIDRTVVLTMPGSTAAVRLAMEKIILPELRHLVQQANK